MVSAHACTVARYGYACAVGTYSRCCSASTIAATRAFLRIVSVGQPRCVACAQARSSQDSGATGAAAGARGLVRVLARTEHALAWPPRDQGSIRARLGSTSAHRLGGARAEEVARRSRRRVRRGCLVELRAEGGVRGLAGPRRTPAAAQRTDPARGVRRLALRPPRAGPQPKHPERALSRGCATQTRSLAPPAQGPGCDDAASRDSVGGGVQARARQPRGNAAARAREPASDQ
mmetsp:Transcript_6286/g.21074  ORF Transcript_6286/g.21074 Transcript_6286/m.21074 type:complete len:233 (-) Transcript_6286:1572-2270(-)